MIDAQYRFNDLIALTGNVTAIPVNQEIYQLGDDSRLAREGYFAEESAEANLGIILTPLKSLSINAGVGVREFCSGIQYLPSKNTCESDPVGPNQKSCQAYLGFNAHF